MCNDPSLTKSEYNSDLPIYAYSVICRFIKKCIKAKRPLSEIYETLKEPPYGLRDGYIPVLLAYALRGYENVSLYFHDEEREYSTITLLEAFAHPSDYYIYICSWDDAQKSYISSLESLFINYISSDSKNRLKELLNAMCRHFTSIAKSARTTEKYVSDKTKKYRELIADTHKDYNSFFFEELFALGSDYDEALQEKFLNVIKISLYFWFSVKLKLLKLTLNYSEHALYIF